MGGQPSKMLGKDKCSSTVQKQKMSIENPVESSIKNSEELQVLEGTSSEYSYLDVHSIKKPVEKNTLEDTSAVENSSKDSKTITKGVEVFVHKSSNKKFIEYTAMSKCDQQSTIQDKTMDIKPHCNHQIRVLTLEEGRFQDDVLYKMKKGWYLEFRLGASLFGSDIIVYTNIPAEGYQFNRKTYRRLDWIREWSSNDVNYDDSSLSCLLQMNQAGSFHYYYEHNGQQKGSGYINVDPNLVAGEKDIPLESLQIVSVLAKCLGQFSSWKSKLQVAKESGYNMIHFTPIQELGSSRSSYSLKNQLALNPSFNDDKCKITFNDVKYLTEEMKKKWNVMSICDIVLNHTANESSWLLDHPECSYNLVNCPYLKPAYLLDYVLYHFSVEVSKGLWEFSGVPSIVDSEEHLASIRHAILATLLPRAKIHELFQLNIDRIMTEFQEKVRAGPPPLAYSKPECNEELILITDPEYRRLSATIDMDKALRLYNIYRSDCFDEDTRLHRCSFELKLKLEALNNKVFDEIQGHLTAAVDNSIAGIRYFRVQPDGPKLTNVSATNPLVSRYFTDFEDQSADDVLNSPNGRFIMAHNGWVMGGDSMKNFAGPDSNVYFRRELIAWGDSVKLRYGEGPKDCPFLWNHMQSYVEQTVTIFDGIRLDNCHSTPLHVAEYLLDAARKIKPDLYVVAELFTNSDAADNIFVNRLGITSFIREAMSAWDSHELGRLVYRYGGEPVGGFIKPLEQPLRPSIAHALFMDQTHDNPSPIEKRSVYDLLPSAALVSMACCASGSNMGYDQLVPHHIHVVDEERHYMSWSDDEININTGIVAGKKALNELHYDLGKQGFDQVYVDQIDTDIVCVTRHNSNTHDTVVLMSYTSFSTPSYQNGLGKGITVNGKVDNLLIEASLEYRSLDTGKEFVKDINKINGLNNYVLNLKQNTSFNECKMLEIVPSDDKSSTRLNFTKNFKPGCVVAVSIVPLEKTKVAFEHLLADIDLVQAVSRLTLTDMNYILFRCAEEDEGNVYDLPGFGKLTYCGIQGFISILDMVAPNNDLGHPLCTNLRNGLWIVDYICGRLKRKEFENCPLYQFGDFLERYFQPLKNLPSYLVPSFFELTLRKVYNALLYRTWSMMPGDIKNCSTFCKSLALASIQFAGIVKSSPLPTLSPNLLAPLLKTLGGPDGKNRPECITLAAGLPHFSSGYMRNWGRDTFISLRGLLLLTGRFEEAKYIILGFGGCLRHGLIPNLLDGGNNPRYNCRDAVWWWLYVIQQYVEMVPGGISILDDPVNRIFPSDDSSPTSVEQPLHEVIQEAMTIHFQGLCFRERNAGFSIDAHMKSPGFDNQIGVQPSTGFVFGGNEWNCGTWMDKMGSSDKAGNRGRPATPRDGSAIELIALSKSAVGWLAKLNKNSKFKYSGVSRINKDGSKTSWTYEDWNTKIQNNFESYFWIPKEKECRSQVEPHPELIFRRGMYKDTVGASNKWGDYQLRCNYPVAMVVAPELFTPDNARIALQTVSDILLGPLGIKTLDPSDWSYNGYYNNDNDTVDPKLANGFNYHQGPEWLWPVGFFLRAKLIFSTNKKETSSEIQRVLSKHYEHIKTSIWRGLPELTNKDGDFCAGSCPTQAWSVSTILETLMDITNLNLS